MHFVPPHLPAVCSRSQSLVSPGTLKEPRQAKHRWTPIHRAAAARRAPGCRVRYRPTQPSAADPEAEANTHLHHDREQDKPWPQSPPTGQSPSAGTWGDNYGRVTHRILHGSRTNQGRRVLHDSCTKQKHRQNQCVRLEVKSVTALAGDSKTAGASEACCVPIGALECRALSRLLTCSYSCAQPHLLIFFN